MISLWKVWCVSVLLVLCSVGCVSSDEEFLPESASVKFRPEGTNYEGIKFFLGGGVADESFTCLAIYTKGGKERSLALFEIPELELRWKVETPHDIYGLRLQFAGSSGDVVGASDTEATVWEGKTGNMKRKFRYDSGKIWGVLSSNEQTIILAVNEQHGGLEVIDATTWATLFVIPSDAGPFAFAFQLSAAADELVVSVGSPVSTKKGILIVDSKKGTVKSFLPSPNTPHFLLFSPSGNLLAVASGVARISPPEIIQVWERSDQGGEWKLKWQVEGKERIQFFRNEDYMAYVLPGSSLAMSTLDLRTGMSREPLSPPLTKEFFLCSLLREDPLTISFMKAGLSTMAIYRPDTGRVFFLKGDTIHPNVFLKDSRVIALCGDGCLRAWDIPK